MAVLLAFSLTAAAPHIVSYKVVDWLALAAGIGGMVAMLPWTVGQTMFHVELWKQGGRGRPVVAAVYGGTLAVLSALASWPWNVHAEPSNAVANWTYAAGISALATSSIAAACQSADQNGLPCLTARLIPNGKRRQTLGLHHAGAAIWCTQQHRHEMATAVTVQRL
eukprot:XP_001691737.1 predicted protein [Chlamydomonas reinhardtii]